MNASPRQKFTDNIKPEWWPRVPPSKISRLYKGVSLGLADEELIKEVGTCLFLRCQSILVANEAGAGRAACPRCETIIQHTRDKRQTITCPTCRWQTTWGDYFQTIDGKGLLGGGSLPFVRGYVETYSLATTPSERFLLIDRLIHAFHWELHQQIGMSRPVAVDLIAGRFEEVVDFLDTLTYGDKTPSDVYQEHLSWNQKVERSGEWFREALRLSRERRGQKLSGD
jgi:hypothetical protein